MVTSQSHARMGVGCGVYEAEEAANPFILAG